MSEIDDSLEQRIASTLLRTLPIWATYLMYAGVGVLAGLQGGAAHYAPPASAGTKTDPDDVAGGPTGTRGERGHAHHETRSDPPMNDRTHRPTDPTRTAAASSDEAAGPYCACGRTATVLITTRYDRAYYECSPCRLEHLDAGDETHPLVPEFDISVARDAEPGGRLTDPETGDWIDTRSDAHLIDLEAHR